jgi:hypothetical protein
MAQQLHGPKGELEALVENAGGLASLAAYLETSPEMLSLALGAPAGTRTDKVCAMVEENTRKLLLMPSQGGWIWKVTRRRVVKDWLILARWSEANGGCR